MVKMVIDRFKNSSPGVKSSLAFAVASAVSAGISYLTTPIFTRMLSSAEYGEVTVYLTWQSIFAIVAMFSLNYGVFNNGMMDYSDDRDNYSFSMLGLSNVVTICFGLIILLGKVTVPSLIVIEDKYLLLMFTVFLFQPAYNFWLARQKYEYNYKPALIASICIAVLGPLVSVIAVVYSDDKVAGRIFGLEGTLLLIYLFFFIRIGSKSHWRCKPSYWKY